MAACCLGLVEPPNYNLALRLLWEMEVMTDEADERARSIREWLESHVSHISRVVCEKHLANELHAYAAERDSKWCEMIARVCGGMAYTPEDDLPKEAEKYIRAFAADEADVHKAAVVEACYLQARGGQTGEEHDRKFREKGLSQMYWKGRSDAASEIRALKPDRDKLLEEK